MQARLAVQEGRLLHGAAALLAVAVLCGCAGRCGRGDVGDLLGVGVLAADLGDADVAGLAGFGEGVVAAVEVLALLEMELVCG
jgi:hypothetical protein